MFLNISFFLFFYGYFAFAVALFFANIVVIDIVLPYSVIERMLI